MSSISIKVMGWLLLVLLSWSVAQDNNQSSSRIDSLSDATLRAYQVPYFPEKAILASVVGIKLAENNLAPYIKTAYQIIDCESGWNPEAKGDGGKSIGLWQIHLPSHNKNITKECALNPECATDYAVWLIKQNGFRDWSCFKKQKTKL